MSNEALLLKIATQLDALTIQQQTMQAQLDALANPPPRPGSAAPFAIPSRSPSDLPATGTSPPLAGTPSAFPHHTLPNATTGEKEREKVLYPGRVQLSSYPSQPAVVPYPLHWGAATPQERGPIICSRLPSTIKARNALGAHSGSYSIYRSLSIALGSLSPTHKPDLCVFLFLV
uniref:GTP cyclohydrolase N-terminal domain-containing protein n=1 Tax=Mycena chlorophos TaxID=658473 RepID=A0ABQ0MCZ9_MYCCL|nr:predicted protein [Mycena chlorophos]